MIKDGIGLFLGVLVLPVLLGYLTLHGWFDWLFIGLALAYTMVQILAIMFVLAYAGHLAINHLKRKGYLD